MLLLFPCIELSTFCLLPYVPPWPLFLLLLLVLWCCWKKDRREHSVWHTSCFFFQPRQPIRRAGFSFSFSAGFPCCCYIPASSLTSSAKLCVEASVNMFRCGNTNSSGRKCTYRLHMRNPSWPGDKMIVFL